MAARQRNWTALVGSCVRPRPVLRVEELEGRRLFSADPVTIIPGQSLHASLAAPGDAGLFSVTLPQAGTLTARETHDAGSSLAGRLDLLGSDRGVLLSTDGTPDATLAEYLSPGTYYLSLTAAGGM